MRVARNFKGKMKMAKNKKDKAAVAVYFVVRGLIILCIVRQILLGNYYDVFLCALSLVLIFIPEFIERNTKIELPSALETAVFCFVYAAEILGEIESFYIHIPIWDTMLHTANGFLAAAVGFGFIDLINTKAKRTHMSPIFVVIVSFCFSMTIGVLWEFFEFSADEILRTDMQKGEIVSVISTVELDETRTNKPVVVEDIDHTVLYDKDNNEIAVIKDGYFDIGLIDTMEDLFVNMIGAIVFSVFGYMYLQNKGRGRFIENFIVSLKETS